MIDAGISVAVVSWWGQASRAESTDTQGVCTDSVVGTVLAVADEFEGRIEIAFHLEPYPSRSAQSFSADVQYIHRIYGHHNSIHRQRNHVVFYVYDSYHIPVRDWQSVLQPDGVQSIRKLKEKSLFIGLWLERDHGADLHAAGFDGGYSYFAADGFSYGSSTRHWREMCSFLHERGMLCSLSVGPGYDDTGIRPWNKHNARDRDDGRYYQRMWQSALNAEPSFVSITSFNEWGEGTQIEPAIDKVVDAKDGLVDPITGLVLTRRYPSYTNQSTATEDPTYYLQLTAQYSALFQQHDRRYPTPLLLNAAEL